MPPFAGGPEEWAAWSEGFRALARRPNVTVKYASLLLYAEPVADLARLRPPAEFLLETFGPPADVGQQLAGGAALRVVPRHLRRDAGVRRAALAAEQAELYGGTAWRAYRIP